MGFEPTTSYSTGRRSNQAELQPPLLMPIVYRMEAIRVKSRLLAEQEPEHRPGLHGQECAEIPYPQPAIAVEVYGI